MAALKPAQHDLFALDSPLYGKVHGERSVMEFPFFGLTKRPHKERIVFESGNVKVTVRPSDTGLATIYDKEVLLYVAGLLASKMERGEEITQDITFTAHDFFRVTNASPSARSYQRLNEALTRLQGTQVMTNIKSGDTGIRGWFSWLEKAAGEYVDNGNGDERLKAIRVRLCDWLFHAILKERRILAYHHDYFKLGPIERRLYEVARSHCETTGSYSVDIEELRLKVGCGRVVSSFKHALRKVEASDGLPQYRIRVEDVPSRRASAKEPKTAARSIVHFSLKDAAGLGHAAGAEVMRLQGAGAGAASGAWNEPIAAAAVSEK